MGTGPLNHKQRHLGFADGPTLRGFGICAASRRGVPTGFFQFSSIQEGVPTTLRQVAAGAEVLGVRDPSFTNTAIVIGEGCIRASRRASIFVAGSDISGLDHRPRGVVSVYKNLPDTGERCWSVC